MIQQRFLEMLQSRPGILGSKQRFSGMLKDYFPQTPIVVRLMISLYEMGVHSEIEIEAENNIRQCAAWKSEQETRLRELESSLRIPYTERLEHGQ